LTATAVISAVALVVAALATLMVLRRPAPALV
jgi:hypothetical protein